MPITIGKVNIDQNNSQLTKFFALSGASNKNNARGATMEVGIKAKKEGTIFNKKTILLSLMLLKMLHIQFLLYSDIITNLTWKK